MRWCCRGSQSCAAPAPLVCLTPGQVSKQPLYIVQTVMTKVVRLHLLSPGRYPGHAEICILWRQDYRLQCREENVVAIDLITQHIRMKLQQPDLRRIYHNLEVIPSNFQIRGMHTILRDQNTNKADFVFIADRLLRLVSTSLIGMCCLFCLLSVCDKQRQSSRPKRAA